MEEGCSTGRVSACNTGIWERYSEHQRSNPGRRDLEDVMIIKCTDLLKGVDEDVLQ